MRLLAAVTLDRREAPVGLRYVFRGSSNIVVNSSYTALKAGLEVVVLAPAALVGTDMHLGCVYMVLEVVAMVRDPWTGNDMRFVCKAPAGLKEEKRSGGEELLGGRGSKAESVQVLGGTFWSCLSCWIFSGVFRFSLVKQSACGNSKREQQRQSSWRTASSRDFDSGAHFTFVRTPIHTTLIYTRQALAFSASSCLQYACTPSPTSYHIWLVLLGSMDHPCTLLSVKWVPPPIQFRHVAFHHAKGLHSQTPRVFWRPNTGCGVRVSERRPRPRPDIKSGSEAVSSYRVVGRIRASCGFSRRARNTHGDAEMEFREEHWDGLNGGRKY